jgi:hypothetical protein
MSAGSVVLVEERRVAPRAGDDPRVSHRLGAAQRGDAVPADPPRPEEIIVVMREAGMDQFGSSNSPPG